MHAADLLTKNIRDTSPVCVGLDPQMEKLPEGLSKDINGLREFCKGMIDAVGGIASCIKPQMAFFELYRAEGMQLFWDICAYAQSKNFFVIADGKRNDIGSTCEAYADAYLGKNSPIDALTITPFMGSDGVLPFVERCKKNGKMIFVQVKNSNPSSGEIQDLPSGDEVVHEHLAHLVEGWAATCLGDASNLSCVGAVVGATYPEELKYLRTLMPHVPFLIPGYGAQGGTAADVKHGFIGDIGAIVNSSRGIIYASSGKDWRDAAAKEAQKMRGALRAG